MKGQKTLGKEFSRIGDGFYSLLDDPRMHLLVGACSVTLATVELVCYKFDYAPAMMGLGLFCIGFGWYGLRDRKATLA